MRPVTRQDWKAEPLLPPRSPVPLVRRYDSLQLDRLRHGVKPRAMEEKWFVFTEGDTVFLHRSWTGLGVFEVVLRREGTGAAIEQAWVSAHPERVRDVSAVASMLDDILNHVVLQTWRTGAPPNRPPLGARDRVWVWQGDITTLAVDAIANAANASLPGGGDAKVTPGFDLPSNWVIHTVGPVWRGGGHDEEAHLRSCYRRILALARAHGVETLATPAVSTGVYGYPVDAAARVAAEELGAALRSGDAPRLTILNTFDAATTAAFQAARAAVLGQPGSGP